jgi:hypothetical protein
MFLFVYLVYFVGTKKYQTWTPKRLFEQHNFEMEINTILLFFLLAGKQWP